MAKTKTESIEEKKEVLTKKGEKIEMETKRGKDLTETKSRAEIGIDEKVGMEKVVE
jgi:hypothetical protein